MITEIKEFIEKHIDLIEDGRFEELYKLQSKWYTVELARLVGIFTETLLSADIDPAKYMKKIPPFYLNGTKIASYTIPQNITAIDWSAFIDCNEFTSVTIPDSVTSIGDYAFGYCEGLTSVTIGNSVKSIGKYAFTYGGKLTDVTIGNNVTYIGDYAFERCEELTRINFKGTISQWNKIKLDPMWKTDSLQLKEIKCTDGTIIL